MLHEAVGAGDPTLFSVKLISRSITSFSLFSLGLLLPGKALLFPPPLLPFLRTDDSSELQRKDSSLKTLPGHMGKAWRCLSRSGKASHLAVNSSLGSWGGKWGKALLEGLGRLTGVLEASPKGSVWISRRLQCKKHERRLQETGIFSAKHTTCFAPQIYLAETSLWACKPSISEFKAEAVNCICLLANALKKPYFVHAKRKMGGIRKCSSCRALAEGTCYFLSTRALSRTWGNCKGLWCIPWWQRRPTRQYVRTAGCCTITRPWHAWGSGAISPPEHQPKKHSQSPAF